MTDVPATVLDALARARSPVCAYVYDTATLTGTADAVRAAMPGASILYAIKANGHPSVIATLAARLDGLEVASGGELALAVHAGAARIAFGGPAKTDPELTAAVGAIERGFDLTVNAESAHELRRLALVASGVRVPVALRVNRAVAGPTGSHRMTGVATPFGIDESALADAVAVAKSRPEIDLVGFHLHAVSNNLDAVAHAAFLTDAIDWSRRAATRYGIDLREVNAGGGFGVDYTGGQRFDLTRLTGCAPGDVRLTVEPGRFLAAGAGWYAAEVIDLKHNHGRWFAVLRGGTHHFRLPAAWGYSHPFTVLPKDGWPYPFDRFEVRDVDVDAVGELCTPRDVLTRGQRVPRLRIGDVLVFANTGAYGWDISHHSFLRHPAPEFLVV
jgi:diaminopimelate decarboxylase